MGLVSWLAGIPLIWPSLGPTAYILAFDEDKNHRFEKVFGAHVLGALSGLLTHHIFATDLSINSISYPLESTGINIAISAIVALSLTTGLMRGTGWTHSPACATTLIIALGLISGSQATGVLFILGAVILIYGIHLINKRLFEMIGWID